MGDNEITKNHDEQKKLLTEGLLTVLKTDTGKNAPEENKSKVIQAGITITKILAVRYAEMCEEKGLKKPDDEYIPSEFQETVIELMAMFPQLVYDHVWDIFEDEEEEPADDRVHAVIGEGIDKAFEYVGKRLDEIVKSKETKTN